MSRQCQASNLNIQANKKCFIGGLNPATTKKHLIEHFSCFGEIAKVSLPRWNHSRDLKGYAFLHFISESSVEQLLALGTSQVLLGSDLDIRSFICSKIASKRSKSLQQKKIYVSGFPKNAKRGQIIEFFKKFGHVEQLIMQHRFVAGRKIFKGFLFLIMKDEDAYDTILKQKNLYYDNFRLSVSKAFSKNQIITHNAQTEAKGRRKLSSETLDSPGNPVCLKNQRKSSNILEQALSVSEKRLRLNIKEKNIKNVVQLKVGQKLNENSEIEYIQRIFMKQSYFGRENKIEYTN